MILDDMGAYLVDAPLEDAGKKSFGITRIEGLETVRAILDSLDPGEEVVPDEDTKALGGRENRIDR